MSITSDLAIVGGIGIGAYLLLTNADKIGAWIAKGAAKAATDIAEDVSKGAASETLFPENPTVTPLFKEPSKETYSDFLASLFNISGILPSLGGAAMGIQGIIGGNLLQVFNPYNYQKGVIQ